MSAQLAILAVVIVAAQTVETITGFGATVIALALGAQIFPVETLVMALVLIGLPQSLWIVARGWRHLDRRTLLLKILPLCGAGLAAGRLLEGRLDGAQLKLALGIFVIAVSSVELARLVRNSGRTAPMPRMAGGAVLLGGGFVHGIFATGGPLIVYYASRAIPDKAAFRVTLSVLWLILNVTLCVTWLAGPGIKPESLLIAAWMIAPLAAGIVLGELLHGRINDLVFRKVVQALLLIIGVLLVV
ncbi:MAG: sulfite exporter TauE/SafE family protein [Myxococcota bacterium]|jgi:hypothetical protein